jgi:hypothetical protein
MGRQVRAAAIQLQCRLGDISYNLGECERLATEAGQAGARWIVLPEFFTTGIGFSPALTGKALPPEGTLLAGRKPEEGPGVIVADVEVGHTEPLEVLPAGEWIRPLAGLGKIMWNLQQAHGRKWYRKHQVANEDRRHRDV